MLIWVLIGSQIVYVGAPSLRIIVNLALFGGCIGGWFTILLFEEFPRNLKILTLVHTRYLDYLKQFLWLIAIVIVSYLAWEIQASGVGSVVEDSSGETVKIVAKHTWVASFVQLLVTTGFGVGLVILAFQRRLIDIESAILEIETSSHQDSLPANEP